MHNRSDVIFAALNAGVVIHAADSTILQANERARTLLGIQDLEGRISTDPQWVFMEADGSTMTHERFPVVQVITTGEPVRLLTMIVQPPVGAPVWLEVNALPAFDDAGELMEIAVTFIDVSARVEAERALAASEEIMRMVLDNAGLCIVRLDRDGHVDYANSQVAALLGKPAETLVGKGLTELGYPGSDSVGWERRVRRVIRKGKPKTFDYETAGEHGHQWHEASLRPLRDAEGTVTYVVLTDRDVTARKQAEASERAQRAQIRQAERAAHVGSWTMDLRTRAFTWSEELLLMHGLDPSGPPPDFPSLRGFYTRESWQRLSAELTSAQKTGSPFELEVEVLRPDGSHAWLQTRGELVRDAAGDPIALHGVCADVSESKRAAEQLHQLATHDPLTGLANRSELFRELGEALVNDRTHGGSTAVLMLDLDHFKYVNDTKGHGFGDALLAAAAARIVAVASVGDLVARTGGDEFVVLMRNLTDPTAAVNEAQRLVVAFRRPFTLGGSELYATASIGVAISGEPTDAGDLVRDADTALYAAKREGRDRIAAFNDELRAAAANRVAIESELRRALERGQLAVWYQPEVELTTGRVKACEALLRWHHPDGTVWPAGRFVDVAEETGMILSIGEWVLRQACEQVVAWTTARPERPPTVRVNFSTLQLAEVGLLDAIDAILADTGADPNVLCVEVTETTLLRETTTAWANLRGLHERGIGIAIDDFGTGYASLTYLNSFPVDVIKIDRSFVTGDADPDHRLVAGIIAFAKVLDIAVTAEGVERTDQASLLATLGCPSAQGWLYAKALPAEEVTPLLDHRFPTV